MARVIRSVALALWARQVSMTLANKARALEPKRKLDNPRHPERTVLYRAVAGHLQTWLALLGAEQFDGPGDQHLAQRPM